MEYSTFWTALVNKDFDKAMALLMEGENINYCMYTKDVGAWDGPEYEDVKINYLSEAFKLKRLDIINFLLKHGADLEPAAVAFENLVKETNALFVNKTIDIIRDAMKERSNVNEKQEVATFANNEFRMFSHAEYKKEANPASLPRYRVTPF